jgi:hypothetical protein
MAGEDAVMALIEKPFRHLHEGTEENHRTRSKDGMCSGRRGNGAPPEHK